MESKPMNLVFIMSDAHNRGMLGCYGHPIVKTPNLDRIAAEGVRFSNAYCNSPICVPSRTCLATGRYVHNNGSWDNAFPYSGEVASWGHRLSEQGHRVVKIGKLHYRNDSDETGFPDQRNTLHVVNGTGDLFTLIRQGMKVRSGLRKMIIEAGEGESSYTMYDRSTTEEAVRFLTEEAGQIDKPWVLFVSYVRPHYPYTAPQEYLDLYNDEDVHLPVQYRLGERPMHLVLEEFRRVKNVSDEFNEEILRRAIKSYYALCSFMDDQVGILLRAVVEGGLSDRTRILYTSDHGDSLGDHALWCRADMYEGNVGVPFIMSGPDLPRGCVVEEPVSLVDCFPTILDAVGAEWKDADCQLPGTSLLPIARGEIILDRTVFSEYHAVGSITGIFMIRHGRYKYVHYVNYDPQLFDLDNDPDELNDLASNIAYKHVLTMCEQRLRSIVEPEEVDRMAKEAQNVKIQQYGGREAIFQNYSQIEFTPIPKMV